MKDSATHIDESDQYSPATLTRVIGDHLEMVLAPTLRLHYFSRDSRDPDYIQGIDHPFIWIQADSQDHLCRIYLDLRGTTLYISPSQLTSVDKLDSVLPTFDLTDPQFFERVAAYVEQHVYD